MGDSVRDEIVVMVRREIESLVHEAGKTLRLTVGRSRGDLNIDFDSSRPAAHACASELYGEDGGEAVFVNAHREARVCAVDAQTGSRDKRRFLGAGYLLGRALANTAIHELGHFIALLDDLADSSNYMISGKAPPGDRNVRGKQRFFGGHKTFTADQREKLVKQIKAGEWLGDLGFR